MSGWIKISRDMSDHWLWHDAERLKWWLDLLFMASWEDRQVMHDSHVFVLRRGQMIASIAYLSERWGKSKPTVISYLRMLEFDGMVYRQVLYRQTSVITVCNYDKYQVQEPNLVDTIVDTQVDTIVDTNKEYNNSTTTTSIARARKKNFLEELKKSEIWLDQMSMRFRIPSGEVVKRLDDFALDCFCRGTEHQDFSDARRHFNDWLRIQLEAERKKQQHHVPDKTRPEDKRRSYEVEASSAEDYKTSF